MPPVFGVPAAVGVVDLQSQPEELELLPLEVPDDELFLLPPPQAVDHQADGGQRWHPIPRSFV